MPTDKELYDQYLREIYDQEMAATGSSTVEEAEPKIIEEMHPDISFTTRALYKNLAVDPEQGFQFLQKENPELQFKKFDGRVLAKRPEEKDWRVLDPSGFDLQDISDVGVDVAGGLAETMGAAAGGIGGGLAGMLGGPAAPVTVPAGALTGAAAGGAATATGVEAARQGLGKFFGVAKEMSPEKMKEAAMWGAGAPLLFGTGAAGKQVLKAGAKGIGKTLFEKGAARMGEEGARQALQQAQRGAGGYGLGYVKSTIAPKIGQAMSGVEADTIKWASQNLDKIAAAEKEYGQAEVYKTLRNTLEGAQDTELKKIGGQIGDALDNLEVEIPVAEIQAPLKNLLDKYEQRAMRYVEEFGEEAAQNYKPYQDYMFIKEKLGQYGSPFEVLRGREAINFKADLNDLTGIRKSAEIGKKLSPLEKDLQRAARQSADLLDSKIVASAPELGRLNKDYKYALERGNVLNKYFKDDEATGRTLHSLLSRKKNVVRKKLGQIDKELSTDILESAKQQVALDLFSKPSMDLLSLGGTTSTSRSVPLGGLGGLIGYGVGGRLGQGHGGGAVGAGIGLYLGSKIGSPATLRKAMEVNRAMSAPWRALQRQSVPGVGTAVPQTGAQILQNIYQNYPGE